MSLQTLRKLYGDESAELGAFDERQFIPSTLWSIKFT